MIILSPLSPQPMHIPDGFTSVAVAIALWIVSIVVVAYALKRTSEDLDEHRAPMMGVLAAAVFAGQMLNFTVIGGTSGHMMGAAITTILLGPWAAILVMTTVVGVQALIFQDGGLLALGANIFNMAIIGVAVSYFVYRGALVLAKGKSWGIFAGGYASAWLSVVVVSTAVAIELAVSGTSPANIAIPAMAGIHALIGIGEGIITVGALTLIYSTRPDILKTIGGNRIGNAILWIAGLGISLALAILSPLASANPDGLERVAEQRGFINLAKEPIFNIIPDYVFPGITNEALATILAGIIGTLVVFGVALIVTYTRRERRSPSNQ